MKKWNSIPYFYHEGKISFTSKEIDDFPMCFGAHCQQDFGSSTTVLSLF